ncbi:hypothetical protein DSCA_33880 [Desulfosarcina alkanivorans]|uniref:Uncharacterized protein n=1 Tax=Desulfosarcina alkanivorans TaxID=571177 RepID=A0A5K7YKV5_9BACT|nr:hypothetical protein DSCA_33880 [Desulfosarcina alkanivorans]
MNHGICHICGTLFKPFTSTCSVCGFEGLPDCDDWMPDERNFSESRSDDLIQKELGRGLDEEDLLDFN